MEYSLSAAQNLKPWKPGQSGNPGGKPRLPDELRAIASLTPTIAVKLISKYAWMGEADFEVAVKNPDTPRIELAIAAIFMKVIKSGDFSGLAFLFERALGKIPVVAETDEEKRARQELQQLSDQELIKLVKDKIPELQGGDPEKA